MADFFAGLRIVAEQVTTKLPSSAQQMVMTCGRVLVKNNVELIIPGDNEQPASLPRSPAKEAALAAANKGGGVD